MVQTVYFSLKSYFVDKFYGLVASFPVVTSYGGVPLKKKCRGTLKSGNLKRKENYGGDTGKGNLSNPQVVTTAQRNKNVR